MNEPELFAATESLAEAMVQRGLRTPEVWVVAQSGNVARVWLNWATVDCSWSDKTEVITGDDLADACAKAAAWIAALPTPETRAMTDHMTRVADCIDKGRADGIDDAYIAPLVVVKSAMAENLLAAPVA